MICKQCSKKSATVHLTEIVNNAKKEIHLCEECAREQGISGKVSFEISDLLSGLVEPQAAPSAEAQPDRCPTCGISYAEFRSAGRLGCPRDYEVFEPGLLPLLEKIHSGTQHVGKMPKHVGERVAREREVMALTTELEKAIGSEQYERAAEIRDRIRTLRTG